MKYTEQKETHAKELNEFPGLFFAFSAEQLKKGIERVGASPEDKVVSIGGGGYLLNSKVREFEEMMERHEAEKKEIKKDPKILLEALIYELNNHEYSYTQDVSDALAALDLTIEEVPPEILKMAKLAASES